MVSTELCASRDTLDLERFEVEATDGGNGLPAGGDSAGVARAQALCDRALDLLYADQRAGTLAVDEEVVSVVEAIRTELAKLAG